MRTDGGLGRLLFFWCNTTLLPELPTANGVWDDVFLMMWMEPYGISLLHAMERLVCVSRWPNRPSLFSLY